MSKIDYEVIANLIVLAKEYNPEAAKGLNELTMMLSGAFLQSNKRFSTYLFLKASEHPSAGQFTDESLDTTWAKFQQQLQENN